MCRLFLYVSNKNTILPIRYIRSFINISKEGASKKCGLRSHGDGFGFVWLSDNGFGVYKSLNPIWEEEIDVPKGRLFLIHARKASMGGVNFLNTHPFIKHNLILAHNGNIYGFSRLPSNCELEGETDSEKFLTLLVRFLKYYNDLEKAFIEAIKNIDLQTSILNTIIISPDERKVIGSNFFSMYRTNCPLYYSMWMKMRQNEVIVSSEPLDDEDWMILSKEPKTLTIFSINIDHITMTKITRTNLHKSLL